MRKIEIKNIFHILMMELKIRKKTILFWALGIIGIMSLYMGLFKTLASTMGEEFEKLPPELLQIVGGNLDLTNYNQYFGMVYKIVSMVIGAYVFINITSSIHDEINKNTSEYLYSQRLSRSEVIIAKLLCSIIIFALLNILCLLTGEMIGEIINEPTFEFIGILKITLLTSLPCFIFIGCGVFIASLLKRNMKSIGVCLAIFFSLFLIGYLSSLAGDTLSFLKWFSPLDYISYKDIIDGNNILLGILLSIILSLGFTISGILLYAKRDL